MRKDPELRVDRKKELLDLVYRTSLATGFRQGLSSFLDTAATLIPCDGASVMWLDSEHLEVLASRGSNTPLPGLSLPVSQMGCAQALIDGGRHVLVVDTLLDKNWQPVPGEDRVRCWLGAPLTLDTRIVGLVEWTARQPGRFDQDDAETAGEIGRLGAPLLHRLQLHDDMRQRLRESPDFQRAPALNGIERSTSVPPGSREGAAALPDPGLEPLVLEALDFALARRAFAFVLDPERQRFRCVAAAGEGREDMLRTTIRGDGSMEGWGAAAVQTTARRIGGTSDREVLTSLGLDALLVLPLRVGGHQVGMLGVANPRPGRRFDHQSMRIMTHLASQASLLLERTYDDRSQPQPEQYDYEAVMRSSPLGMGVLAASGEILVCNPALATLLSRSDWHLVGRRLAEFVLPADRQRLDQALEEVAVTGHRRQVDARVRPQYGEQRSVRFFLSLAHEAREAGRCLVAIMEDVTALKILEQERVEHLRELREKHDQLEELNRLKSRFVSNVSHELRTPLAVIKLYAALARKGRPEKRAHYLQTIEQEIQRLETMVENILDLTRIDRQAIQVAQEWQSVSEIVGRVIEVYGETARRRGIDFRNRVNPDLPPLWADPNHLIQMLTNLVDNALKYTPRDGRVWVAARTSGDSLRPTIEIAVGDSGPGIPTAEQDQVFERFFRGSNNTSSTTGTGLGLSIVRELMAAHDGQVTLKSRPGRGSIFALHFPLVESSNLPAPAVGGPPFASEDSVSPSSAGDPPRGAPVPTPIELTDRGETP